MNQSGKDDSSYDRLQEMRTLFDQLSDDCAELWTFSYGWNYALQEESYFQIIYSKQT
jgi:hypothetical protein